MTKNRIQQPAPNLSGQPRVDFNKNRFDALVWTKGQDVDWERAIKCPCKREGGQPAPTCMNCHGLGYIFTDLVSTKMVVQAMNQSSKNKAWSMEMIGTLSVTALAENSLNFMDRITLKEIKTIYNQVVFIRRAAQNKLFAFTVYPVLKILYAGLFQNTNLPLIDLDIGLITLKNGYIYFNNPELKNLEKPSITIRYEHYPTYNVLDLQREAMVTSVKDKLAQGVEVPKSMPIHAMVRRSQYIFDQENLANNQNMDNNIGDELEKPPR